MIDIRVAKEEDIEQALPLVKSFYNESLSEYKFPFTENALRKEMEKYVETSSALVMVQDGVLVGVIAGKLVSMIYCDYKVFQETLWYVLPEHRGHGLRLFKETEKHCKSMGVNSIIMGHMCNLNDEKMGKFYQAMGYKCMEIQYVKKLS